jgi:glycosyltransferase involved in cell wall biosynthesis
VELLAELSALADIRLVAPPGWERPVGWPLDDRVQLVSTDTAPEPGELQLVHVGNNPSHSWLLGRLESSDTIVVLHDAVVHHLLVETTIAMGDLDRYRQLVVSAHGPAAEALARARSVGVTGRRDPFLFPARRAVLEGVRGVVVHSRWAERQVKSDLPSIECRTVGLAVADPGTVDREAVRRRLGIDPESVTVMHLGFLTPDKGMLDILTGVSAARKSGVAVRLVLVGEGREGAQLHRVVDSLDLSRSVSFTGWVPHAEMCELPAAADLGIVLRAPSAGETSAAAIRFLACGTPVAVTGLDQFLEWPSAAAPRITPGASSAADLARLLSDMAADPDGWSTRRVAARAAYEVNHRPADVALHLIDALREIGKTSEHA